MSLGSRMIVLLGMMTKIPVSGVVWQTVHYLEGLRRLGYDVRYVEAHARTPSMFMGREEDDGSMRAAAFIERVMRRFGFESCWAYHALHDDGRVYGMSSSALQRLYREAELIINLHGGTDPLPDQASTGRLVYVETDPVDIQVELHHEVRQTIDYLEPHSALFTFGENYGAADCRLPVSDRFAFLATRQPVVLDFWPATGRPFRDELTTIASWRQPWRTVTLDGETYYWSKDLEFRKVLDLPMRTAQQRFELALGAYDSDDRRLLESYGWSVREAAPLSEDLDLYRGYVSGSRGEFTVAKDQNVRLRTGWFSDRSATYLAAGRPVITQSTGFENVLPTGHGLLAFSTVEEATAAVEELRGDYDRHSRAALEIAREYFDAETVLRRLLDDVGVTRAGKAFPIDMSLVPISRRPTLLPASTAEQLLSRPLPDGAYTPGEPEVTVVVVTADGLPFTRLCLESVLAGAGLPLEAIVVDNASRDGTTEYLTALAARDARVRVILNDANRGFAPAVNQGLAIARGETLVVLNNDTAVPPGALRLLVSHLGDSTIGLVGPVSNDAATEAEVDGRYETWGGLVREARRHARDHAGELVDVPMLTMFCVAMRRDVYEHVGPLDEQFEVGFFEDDDYSLRVRDAGYRVVYAEDVLVHHAGEASFGALVPTGERATIFAENRRRFEEKWDVEWQPHGFRTSPEYDGLRQRIRDVVNQAVPPDARVLVVSKGDEELLALDGRRASHFPQLNGEYAGYYPKDSDEAIIQVEALRATGAGVLVFPQPSLWWLDYYGRLREYLDERCAKTVAEDESCIIYSFEGHH